jgi:hypothetical protein
VFYKRGSHTVLVVVLRVVSGDGGRLCRAPMRSSALRCSANSSTDSTYCTESALSLEEAQEVHS